MPKGERIKDLGTLRLSAQMRLSVTVPDSPCWHKPTPAAFVLRLQGSVIHDLFKKGMYVYLTQKDKEDTMDRENVQKAAEIEAKLKEAETQLTRMERADHAELRFYRTGVTNSETKVIAAIEDDDIAEMIRQTMINKFQRRTQQLREQLWEL